MTKEKYCIIKQPDRKCLYIL